MPGIENTIKSLFYAQVIYKVWLCTFDSQQLTFFLTVHNHHH